MRTARRAARCAAGLTVARLYVRTRWCYQKGKRITSIRRSAWGETYSPLINYKGIVDKWNTGGKGKYASTMYRKGRFCILLQIGGACVTNSYPWGKVAVDALPSSRVWTGGG